MLDRLNTFPELIQALLVDRKFSGAFRELLLNPIKSLIDADRLVFQFDVQSLKAYLERFDPFIVVCLVAELIYEEWELRGDRVCHRPSDSLREDRSLLWGEYMLA